MKLIQSGPTNYAKYGKVDSNVFTALFKFTT